MKSSRTIRGRRRFLAAAAVSWFAAPASAGDILATHPKEPDAIIFERGDYAGRSSSAKARVTRRSAEDWCGNWRPGEPVQPCADEIMKSEAGRTYEASANCHSGELTSVFGDRYVYDGLIENDPMWSGWARFKDVGGKAVGTSNAEGGLSLAAQWRTLCPYGAPFDKQPLKMILAEDDYSGAGELAGHNGSGVLIDSQKGTISYRVVKDSLVGFIEQGTVLFRGSIVYDGLVEGMAFTFKKGCDPAPYLVEGGFEKDKLILRGEAPVREGCKVVGYSKKSANARLVFDLPHH